MKANKYEVLETFVAIALRDCPFPVNDKTISAFLNECKEGKHPLSDEDRRALIRARPKLRREIKRILNQSQRRKP